MFITVLIAALIPLLTFASSFADDKLDGNSFFIYNNLYSHARITSFNDEDKEIGTYEGPNYVDQLWFLKKDSNYPGYYYIVNEKFQHRRITKFSKDGNDVGTYSGNYYSDQLWRFEEANDGSYLIYNLKYNSSRLTKFGSDNYNWGTYDGKIYADQYWRLVPRYTSVIVEKTIWEVDNTQGSAPFSETVTLTHGVSVSNTDSFQKLLGFSKSLQTSIELASGPESATPSVRSELQKEVETMTALDNSKLWSVKRKITLTAPARKKYKVVQFQSLSRSLLEGDSVTEKGSYKIYES